MVLWCVPDDFKGVGKADYFSGSGRSASLDWWSEQTGKEFELTVDYTQVLDIVYYGTDCPPERDFSDQINDWLSGHMWGRYQVNDRCEKDENGGYFYWVKYKAELYELEPTPPRFRMECKLLPLVPNAIYNLSAKISEFVYNLLQKVTPLGFTIENCYVENSTLYVDFKEVGSPIGWVVAAIVIAVCAAFGIAVVSWKGIVGEREMTKRQTALQDFWDARYQALIGEGVDPETAARLATDASEAVKQEQEKENWTKYLMYGVLAIVGIIAVKYLVIPMLEHRGD